LDNKELIDKTVDVLRPFETKNLMDTIQNVTLQQIFSNWLFLLALVCIFFFGIYKRSKTVLLTLFFLLALIVMVKFAMPASDAEVGLKSIIPFAAFGLGIGGVIVYFTFIKD